MAVASKRRRSQKKSGKQLKKQPQKKQPQKKQPQKKQPQKKLTPEEKSICSRFNLACDNYANATLAREIKVDASTMSRIRSYERVPSLKVLMRFCRVREVSADYILGLSDIRKGWRFEVGEIKSVGIAQLRTLEAVMDFNVPDSSIARWLPFSEEDIELLLGYKLEDPLQLAVVPDGTKTGNLLLVDRRFKKEHVRSYETFIVRYDNEISVCKVRIQEKGSDVVVICIKKNGDLFTVDFRKQASKSDLLIARVLRVISTPEP
jgi:transcriptional regulator with XRE-family HTH domain